MLEVLNWAVAAGFLLLSGTFAYAMNRVANIELPQNSLLGVRTKLSKQSLRNWNVGNFAGRHLLGVQAGLSLLGALALVAYGLFFQVTALSLGAITVAVLLSVGFFYIGNMLVADKAIKEYVDVA